MADAASPNIRRLSERTTHDLRAAVVLAEPSQAVHEIVANALDAGQRCQQITTTEQ
jgi:DNA mismatch repair ATPase MutL